VRALRMITTSPSYVQDTTASSVVSFATAAGGAGGAVPQSQPDAGPSRTTSCPGRGAWHPHPRWEYLVLDSIRLLFVSCICGTNTNIAMLPDKKEKEKKQKNLGIRMELYCLLSGLTRWAIVSPPCRKVGRREAIHEITA